MTVILPLGRVYRRPALELRTEIKMSKYEAMQAAIANRPARPHRYDSTEKLKDALARNNEDAKRYAHSGTRAEVEMLNAVTNELLDELKIRGEL
jgi:hypothetical protein